MTALAVRIFLARVLWPAALLLVTAGALSADSRTTQPPQRIRFVGNSYFSYNDSLHNHVRRLVAAADPALGSRCSTNRRPSAAHRSPTTTSGICWRPVSSVWSSLSTS